MSEGLSDARYPKYQAVRTMLDRARLQLRIMSDRGALSHNCSQPGEVGCMQELMISI